MPEYSYKCPECEMLQTIEHPPGKPPILICPACNERLFRKYLPPRLNMAALWTPPQIREHIENAPRMRDENEVKHGN